MGGRLGRNRNAARNDPFYNSVPPAGPYLPTARPTGPRVDPSGGLGTYNPYQTQAQPLEPGPTASMQNYLGRQTRRQMPNNYGGRYAQGKRF